MEQSKLTYGVVVFWAVALALTGCLEQEFSVGEDMPLIGSPSPAFAVPLVQGGWAFGQALEALPMEGAISDAPGLPVSVSFPFTLFDLEAFPLSTFDEAGETTWTLDDATAAGINALPAGEELNTSFDLNWTWPLPEMASIDSLWASSGDLQVAVSTDVAATWLLTGTCDAVRVGGSPLTIDLALVSDGTTLETVTSTQDLAGASFVFNGSDALDLNWSWDVTIVTSGSTVEVGSGLAVQVLWSDVAFNAAFGQFNTAAPVDFEEHAELPELPSWDPAMFYLAEPSIHLTFSNSFGIGLALQLDAFDFEDNGNVTPLSGSVIQEPIDIAPAGFPGDTAITVYDIQNEGTTPALAEVLTMAADSIHVLGAITLDATGGTSQFAASTDRIRCTGVLEVPLSGWAQNVVWRDTLASSISQALQDAIDPPLDWTDVQEVTLRFILTNGWPLDVSGAFEFLGESGEALLEGPPLQLMGGTIATGLDASHPDYGRVVEPTVEVVDWTISRDLAMELMSQSCTAVAMEWELETTDAAAGDVVRFFSDDRLEMAISARVQCQIDLTP